MNHWTDGLPLWQKKAIVYTSPGFYIGWVLIAVSYLGMVVFCILTDTTTPKSKKQ